MEYLKVNLWGIEIGRLGWEQKTRRAYFIFNQNAEIPDIAPLLAPVRNRNLRLPIYGDDRPLYQGLPPFIADSLPDAWGNTLFDRWVKDSKTPRNKVTPLHKLMFIGSRGMGALEYEPAEPLLGSQRSVDIKALYDLSLKILDARDNAKLDPAEELTMQSLLSVGTSAGGRQIKAILAINDATGEIRSGQADDLPGFEYYILKFGDRSMPIAEIEQAYYEMARIAGIVMGESRLMTVEGVNHFLTRRFDRRDGKLHVQTLAAIAPEAHSYEDLFAVCRELGLSASEIQQLFARMAFNVMANNTDDHNKNFSFLLRQGGKWQLAPAYDMTFIFNSIGTGPNRNHRLGIYGKTSEISKEDLLNFARQNDIKNAEAIIDQVASAISLFGEIAERVKLPQPWRGIIQHALDDSLIAFGYKDNVDNDVFVDAFGRTVSAFKIAANAKGHFEVSAIIDGQRRRRFVRQNMPLYQKLKTLDPINTPLEAKRQFVKDLFSDTTLSDTSK